jgi:host factor-I protein
MARDNNIHRLQDTFLEHLQRKKTPVVVFLSNGVRLQGTIVDYDAYCVLLERDGQQQIVYKHAMTTAVPAGTLDLRDQSDTPAPPLERPRSRPAVIVERKPRSRFPR